jgi:hypothetical protein
MASNKEISNWLKDPERDYALGAALYSKYGRNKNLQRLFSIKFDNESTREKLTYELSKLANVAPVKKAKPKRKKRPLKKQAPKPKVFTPEEAMKTVKMPKSRFKTTEWDSLPDEVKALEKEWRKLYKERAAIKATIAHLPEQNDRKEAAFLILEYGETIQQLFDDIAYYKKHGFLPERDKFKDKIPNDLAEVEKLLRNTNTRISKKKKKKQTDEVKADLKEELQYKELLTQKRTELQNNG